MNHQKLSKILGREDNWKMVPDNWSEFALYSPAFRMADGSRRCFKAVASDGFGYERGGYRLWLVDAKTEKPAHTKPVFTGTTFSEVTRFASSFVRHASFATKEGNHVCL